MEKIDRIGQVRKDGKLGVFESAQVDEWLRKRKGKRILVTYEVIEEDSTRLQVAKYQRVVNSIPETLVDFGNHTNAKLVDAELRITSPYAEEDVLPEEMSKKQLSQHIDWCIQWAAENMGLVI